MRPGLSLIAMLALAGTAAADDDAVRAGAAVGAGGQGDAAYGAVELQLDATWHDVRIGLGARGVWEDGVFRHRDWSRIADIVTILRQLEATLVLASDPAGRPVSQLAIAAGGLAPARLARVVDGHRATLDDRLRTGARGAVSSPAFELGLEIDDVLDPSLIGGAAAWQLAPPWGVHVAAALDPRAPDAMGTHISSVFELGVARRWDAVQRRVEAGASLVGEPREGVTAVGFGTVAIARGGARWTASAELRGGNGTTGATFGPLYRLERLGLIDGARGGVGAAISLGVAAPAFALSIGGRSRPGLDPLGTIAIAAPMAASVQAGGWIAASRAATAGAAEVRIAWTRRLSSALQVARMYETASVMPPAPAWSVTAWFGAATD